MKIIYCYLFAFLAVNSLKAQESSNLTHSFLSEHTVIANLNYSTLPTSINTDKSNIALGSFKDKFIISSYKAYPHTKVHINKYTKKEIPNILCAEVSYDYDLKYPSLFSRFLRSEYNEGAITFNKKNTMAFLTRKKDLKDTDYYLYKTELVDSLNGVWSDPIEVLIDQQSIPLSIPKLSKDNTLLYFAANLPNGYGGYDIYSADYVDGNSFRNLRNLGPEVNTAYNELSAVDEGDFLYYASDLPGGFGGYDIYRISHKKGAYTFKINIGSKINTPHDEINFIPITKSEGYYTSSKTSGINYDIFRYKIAYNQVQVTTTFVDTNQKQIKNLPVEIITEDGDLLFEGFTDTLGSVSIHTTPFREIYYNFSSDIYHTKNKLSYAISDDNPNHFTIIELSTSHQISPPLADTPKFTINSKDNTVYFDFDKYNVRKNEISNIITIAEILKQFPHYKVVLEGYADNRGKPNYNQKLSSKRILSVVAFLQEQGISPDRIIKIPKGSTSAIIPCTLCTPEQNALNRSVHFNFVDKEN